MAAMSFTMHTFDKSLNLWGMPSVTMGQREAKHLSSSYSNSCNNIQTNKALFKALRKLVLNKPDWRFEATNTVSAYSAAEGAAQHVIIDFNIYAGKVSLGTVEVLTRGERDYIRVNNPTIQSGVKRGKGYNTTDPEKAELMIRKTFITPSMTQKMNHEVAAATTSITAIADAAIGTRNRHWERLATARTAFIKSKFDEFVSMLTSVSDIDAAEAYRAAVDNHAVVERLRNAWTQRDKGTTLLVVLDGSQYIVRYMSEVNLYDADNVPEDVRVKVGMLKLTEPQQVVDGIGVKVSNEVFIITNDNNFPTE